MSAAQLCRQELYNTQLGPLLTPILCIWLALEAAQVGNAGASSHIDKTGRKRPVSCLV